MPEIRPSAENLPAPFRVGSFKATAAFNEAPIRVKEPDRVEEIKQGEKVVIMDFTPQGSSTSTRKLASEPANAAELAEVRTTVDIAATVDRIRAMAADYPKFARFLSTESYRDIQWIIGETNGPMARFAQRYLGFQATESNLPQQDGIDPDMQTVTIATRLADFLSEQTQERLDRAARIAKKRAESR